MHPIILIFTRLIFILTLSCFLAEHTALGWNAFGHRVIAEIAFQESSKETREKLLAYTHAMDKLWGFQSFSNSAVWADELPRHDISAFATWHYIDIPYSNDNTPIPEIPKKHQIVWAIQQAERVLNSPYSNFYEKALFLRFLVHFVGDIHQPLHCISLFNSNFLKGDRGGNAYLIQDKKANNLHQLWDRGLGLLLKKKGSEINYAKKLREAYPRTLFLKELKITQVNAWAKASYLLAKTWVYQQPMNKPVSDNYAEKSKDLVEKQLALAGYRLADLLGNLHAQ